MQGVFDGQDKSRENRLTDFSGSGKVLFLPLPVNIW
jgi:hypothetical protein